VAGARAGGSNTPQRTGTVRARVEPLSISGDDMVPVRVPPAAGARPAPRQLVPPTGGTPRGR